MSVTTLPLSRFSDDEWRLAEMLMQRLEGYQAANMEKAAYYEGTNRLKDLGIAIPPQLTKMETVVGWPGTAVDVLEERLDLEGFVFPGDDEALGLRNIFDANDLDVESGQAHLDALIYGTAFAAVGKGADGEPDPLVTVESPRTMTAVYDLRSRRLSSALSQVTNPDGQTVGFTLYLPDQTVYASRDNALGMWRVEDRDEHRLGRLPVARLINRPRTGKTEGRSEISLAVRYYTDAAVRTMLGGEVAREFYSAPQRYVLGASEQAFQNPDGTVKTAWESYLGRVWAIGNDESADGTLTQPKVGQFPAGSPEPFLAQVRTLAQLLAAECAIPASYLGFTTENPSSADAIRQAEARLIKRAERRQRQFGRAWTEVARLCLLIRDGAVPQEFLRVRPKWRDAATPTRMAAAQEAAQLIGAGVLLPDSAVTYDRIGLSETEQARLTEEKRRTEGAARYQQILDSAARARQSSATVAAVTERREPLGDVG